MPRIALVLLATSAALSVARAEAPPKACITAPPTSDVPFAVGEKLEFEMDSMGATIGNFTMAVKPGRGRDNPWIIEARGGTNAFASNFFPVTTFAEAKLGARLESRTYTEDSTENGIRRTLDTGFPVPAAGKLKVLISKDGTAEQFELAAPEDTRDVLSAMYAIRSQSLPDGADVCLNAFGQRRIWVLRAKVTGRESFRTPAGDFRTIHVEGTATRLDKPDQKRELHFWVTDDAQKMPIAAFGLFQNKPVRVQLVNYDPGRRKVAQGPRR